MAQEDLIPFSERSKDEAKYWGSVGGKASGRTRRQKKTTREIAMMVLDLKPDLPEGVMETLYRMGMSRSKKKPTINEVSAAALGQKSMKGDEKAYRILLELAGEADSTPTVNINTTQYINAEASRALVERTMDRLTDEQLKVFEQICAVYSEVEAEETEGPEQEPPEPIEVGEDEGTVE